MKIISYDPYHCRIKENIKVPRHWLWEGNPLVASGVPSQRASNAVPVSIWWRLHALQNMKQSYCGHVVLSVLFLKPPGIQRHHCPLKSSRWMNGYPSVLMLASRLFWHTYIDLQLGGYKSPFLVTVSHYITLFHTIVLSGIQKIAYFSLNFSSYMHQ